MKKRKFYLLATGMLLLLLATTPAMAGPFDFDLTAGGDFGTEGNKGTSISYDILTLSALSGLTPASNLLDFSKIGSVYISGSSDYEDKGTIGSLDGKDKLADKVAPGAGVQNYVFDGKSGTYKTGGSEAISGGGGDQDEALVLTFSEPVVTSSVKLYLSAYTANALNQKDIGLVYVNPTNLVSTPTISEAVLEANLHPAVAGVNWNQVFYLDFSDPAFASLPATLTQIVVRADPPAPEVDGGHFLVSQVLGNTVGVPEPMTLVLLGLGLMGVAGLRKKL